MDDGAYIPLPNTDTLSSPPAPQKVTEAHLALASSSPGALMLPDSTRLTNQSEPSQLSNFLFALQRQ